MAKKTRTYPFRFYGHHPEDWAEGPQMWLLRFVAPPSPEQRVALGRATAEAAFEGAFDLDHFWFSDGAWAVVTSEDDVPESVFDAMGGFAERLHAIAPVAEVILATAKGLGDSSWDRWSGKAEPLPSVFGGVIVPSGDRHVRVDAYYHGGALGDPGYAERCDACDPVPVGQDEGFAAARRERFRALFEASREEALKKAASSSRPALVPLLLEVDPLEALVGAESAARLQHPPINWVRKAETGRIVALAGNYPQHLVLLDPGAEVRTLHPDVAVQPKFSLSPDGASALFTVRREMIELDLETGSHRVVFSHEMQLTAFSAGYCGSADRVMACYGDHTLLLKRGNSGRFEVTDSVEVDGVGLVVLRGALGFLFDSRTTRVVGAAEDALAHLGNLPLKLQSIVFEAEVEGERRVLARQGGQTYEVMNLEKAWDRAFQPKKKPTPRKKAAARRKTAKPRSLKLALVDASAAPDPEHTALWEGCFDWARWIGETASGRAVLRTRTGVGVVQDRKVVQDHRLTDKDLLMVRAAHVHPAAERVLLAHGDETQISELELDTGELRVVVPAEHVATIGGAMYAADGWVVIKWAGTVMLRQINPEGLSAATARIETAHLFLMPIRGGRAAVLTDRDHESQIVEVEYDGAGTPTGLRHVATLKMPGKKYKNHGADPVMEKDGELFLFTEYGCLRASL